MGRKAKHIPLEDDDAHRRYTAFGTFDTRHLLPEPEHPSSPFYKPPPAPGPIDFPLPDWGPDPEPPATPGWFDLPTGPPPGPPKSTSLGSKIKSTLRGGANAGRGDNPH